MRPHFTVCRSIVLGCLLLSGSAAWGQAPVVPSRTALFQRVGMISALDQTEGTVTVNDTQYLLSHALQVYSYDRTARDPQSLRAETRKKERNTLRKGLRIGFTVINDEGQLPGEIPEVWLLPPGKLPEVDPPVRPLGTTARSPGSRKAQRTPASQ